MPEVEYAIAHPPSSDVECLPPAQPPHQALVDVILKSDPSAQETRKSGRWAGGTPYGMSLRHAEKV